MSNQESKFGGELAVNNSNKKNVNDDIKRKDFASAERLRKIDREKANLDKQRRAQKRAQSGVGPQLNAPEEDQDQGSDFWDKSLKLGAETWGTKELLKNMKPFPKKTFVNTPKGSKEATPKEAKAIARQSAKNLNNLPKEQLPNFPGQAFSSKEVPITPNTAKAGEGAQEAVKDAGINTAEKTGAGAAENAGIKAGEAAGETAGKAGVGTAEGVSAGATEGAITGAGTTAAESAVGGAAAAAGETALATGGAAAAETAVAAGATTAAAGGATAGGLAGTLGGPAGIAAGVVIGSAIGAAQAKAEAKKNENKLPEDQTQAGLAGAAKNTGGQIAAAELAKKAALWLAKAGIGANLSWLLPIIAGIFGIAALIGITFLAITMMIAIVESNPVGRNLIKVYNFAIKVNNQLNKIKSIFSRKDKTAIAKALIERDKKYFTQTIEDFSKQLSANRLMSEEQKNNITNKLNELKTVRGNYDNKIKELTEANKSKEEDRDQATREKIIKLKLEVQQIKTQIEKLSNNIYKEVHRCALPEADSTPNQAGYIKIPASLERIRKDNKVDYPESWAKPRTICFLLMLNGWWQETYPESPLHIGDLSDESGKTGKHQEHFQTGNDAQIWAARTIENDEYNSNYLFDPKIARAFVEKIRELAGSNTTIIGNNKQLGDEGLIDYDPNYTSYWFIRIED